MNKVVFCQVDTNLISPDNPCLDYYRKVYPKHEGYAMGRYFMEVPTWIARIAGMLPDEHYEKELHIVQHVPHTIQYLKYMPIDTIVMFSVLDVNKHIIQEVLRDLPPHLVRVCGGYVHPDYVSDWCLWLHRVESLADFLPHVQVDAPPDYSLFKWMDTIPRLTLSTGCLYNCAFCTIEREVQEVDYDQAYDQAKSFNGLNFELVYLNDKTFGQASNWKWLASLGDVISEYNPKFKGFIVQTTVPLAHKYLEEWVKIGVKYIEVGVEAVDQEYLKAMRKPYNLKQLRELVLKLRHGQVKAGFIPNIIFGLPDARYESTLAWLWLNSDVISFINPFILSQYESSKGNMVEGGGEFDTDENALEKSWLSPEEIERTEKAMRHAFYLTG